MKLAVEKGLLTSIEAVKDIVVQEWDKLDPTNYVNSMLNRINECLDNNATYLTLRNLTSLKFFNASQRAARQALEHVILQRFTRWAFPANLPH